VSDSAHKNAPVIDHPTMTSFDVSIPTADGACTAAMSVPDSGGPAPAVIMYPDAGGLRESFRGMGARLASMGYVALVPDVYHRTPYEPFTMSTAFTDEGERTRLFRLMRGLTPDMVVRDTGAFIDFLQARPEVRGTKIGTTGYCMGGRLSLMMAGHHDRIGAAASFHGGNLAVEAEPASPHHLADKVQAKVYVGGAIKDASFSDEQCALLASAYASAGVDATIEWYQALHGFAVPDNPTFDADAAERHWAAMGSLFASALTD
jgi:carboxymethylenebutenolidase